MFHRWLVLSHSPPNELGFRTGNYGPNIKAHTFLSDSTLFYDVVVIWPLIGHPLGYEADKLGEWPCLEWIGPMAGGRNDPLLGTETLLAIPIPTIRLAGLFTSSLATSLGYVKGQFASDFVLN